MPLLFALSSGLIFGLGLILSGMTDPAKVIGFLDVFGQWNPSLAFVMIGAISVSMIGFALVKKRQQTLLGAPVSLPSNQRIDAKLLIGAALFGVGWGIAGFCPGPALVSLSLTLKSAAPFVVAMAIGIYLVDHFLKD